MIRVHPWNTVTNSTWAWLVYIVANISTANKIRRPQTHPLLQLTQRCPMRLPVIAWYPLLIVPERFLENLTGEMLWTTNFTINSVVTVTRTLETSYLRTDMHESSQNGDPFLVAPRQEIMRNCRGSIQHKFNTSTASTAKKARFRDVRKYFHLLSDRSPTWLHQWWLLISQQFLITACQSCLTCTCYTNDLSREQTSSHCEQMWCALGLFEDRKQSTTLSLTKRTTVGRYVSFN